jgi:predicted DNA binding CopG/RHH family protein
MSTTPQIQDADDAWDEGLLGREEKFAQVADHIDIAALDAALDMQMISIRLPKSLIDDFKSIAQLHGLGYQPLMRQALHRFADGEKKMLLQDTAREHVKNKRQREADRAARASAKTSSPSPAEHRTKHKKAA